MIFYNQINIGETKAQGIVFPQLVRGIRLSSQYPNLERYLSSTPPGQTSNHQAEKLAELMGSIFIRNCVVEDYLNSLYVMESSVVIVKMFLKLFHLILCGANPSHIG